MNFHCNNDKIVDLSKFKAFAEDNLDVRQMVELRAKRVENVDGNGCQLFLHFE